MQAKGLVRGISPDDDVDNNNDDNNNSIGHSNNSKNNNNNKNNSNSNSGGSSTKSASSTEAGGVTVGLLFPEEIGQMIVGHGRNWRSMWNSTSSAVASPTTTAVAVTSGISGGGIMVEAEAQGSVSGKQRGYFIDMLHNQLMNAHVQPEFESLGTAPHRLTTHLLQTDLELAGSDVASDGKYATPSLQGDINEDYYASKRLISSTKVRIFREHNTILYSAADALTRILNGYKKRMLEGRIVLVDEDEREALLFKSVGTCNVLIDYEDLRDSMEESWSLFHPGGVEMVADERFEVMSSFNAWIARHGTAYQHLHYHQAHAKLLADQLARIETLQTSSDPILALSTPEVSTSDANKLHFSVPFQRFRQWYMQTCAAIVKYRLIVGNEQKKKEREVHPK